jgi:hypothetical protein
MEDCQGEESCPFESQVSHKANNENGVGRLEISVSFATESAPFNSKNSENQIRIEVPANLHGVELQGRRLFCRQGFKALLISQSPGDFLCAIQ